MKWQTKSFEQLSTTELFEIYKLRTAVFVVEQDCPYQEVDDKDLIAYHHFAKNNRI
ncbi:acetyltransferase [Actinobacillus equuli]|nr:acetyltransferase [Actinobacillus equuli]